MQTDGGRTRSDEDPQGDRAKPRRTIRMALWSGEEEGLFGSTAATSRNIWPVTRTNRHARSSTRTSISIPAPDRSTAGISKTMPRWHQYSMHGSSLLRTWVPTKRSPANRQHRSCELYSCRCSGVQSGTGLCRLRHPHSPHKYGHLRASKGTRPKALGDHPRVVRVPCRDAERATADRPHLK